MLQFKDIFTYIFVIGVAQGVQLTIFLLRKQENRLANRFLAIEMLVMSVHIFLGVFYLNGSIKNFPQVLGFTNTAPYLYGPLFYLFVRYLVKKESDFRKIHLLHFVPFLLLQLYGLLFFYFEDSGYIIALITPPFNNPWHIELIGKFIPVSGVIYTYLSIRDTLKYNRAIKECFSNIDKINLQWLIYYVTGGAIVWVIVISTYVVDLFWGYETQAGVYIIVAMALFLMAIGYKSLTQKEIAEVEEIKNEPEEPAQYKKSGLSEQSASGILNDLLNVMEKKKPYLSSELKLGDLAAMIGATNHNLSEVINTKLSQNFYDFINKYRVEEVKKLILKDSSNTYSILGLGYEAGFSSKSAFYSAFKKQTGKTPSEFRSENKAA